MGPASGLPRAYFNRGSWLELRNAGKPAGGAQTAFFQIVNWRHWRSWLAGNAARLAHTHSAGSSRDDVAIAASLVELRCGMIESRLGVNHHVLVLLRHKLGGATVEDIHISRMELAVHLLLLPILILVHSFTGAHLQGSIAVPSNVFVRFAVFLLVSGYAHSDGVVVAGHDNEADDTNGSNDENNQSNDDKFETAAFSFSFATNYPGLCHHYSVLDDQRSLLLFFFSWLRTFLLHITNI